MAQKKATKTKRAANRITLPEILGIIEKAYDPDGLLASTFAEVTDDKGHLTHPDDLQDTLAVFLIREMREVFNKRAGAKTNLEQAAETIRSAIEQLVRVEGALLQALYSDDWRAKR